jgi:hypothetical protein
MYKKEKRRFFWIPFGVVQSIILIAKCYSKLSLQKLTLIIVILLQESSDQLTESERIELKSFTLNINYNIMTVFFHLLQPQRVLVLIPSMESINSLNRFCFSKIILRSVWQVNFLPSIFALVSIGQCFIRYFFRWISSIIFCFIVIRC